MTGGVRDQVRDALATQLAARDPAPFDALPEVDALLERFDFVDDPDPAIDGYWVNEPYARVDLRRDTESDEIRYHVLEPTRSDFVSYVAEDLRDVARRVLLDEEFENDDAGRAAFADRLDEVIARHASSVPPADRWVVRYYLRRDFLGYGRLDPFMSDPAVEDVSCDGADVPVYAYHRDHGHLASNRAWAADVVDSLRARAGRGERPRRRRARRWAAPGRDRLRRPARRDRRRGLPRHHVPVLAAGGVALLRPRRLSRV